MGALYRSRSLQAAPVGIFVVGGALLVLLAGKVNLPAVAAKPLSGASRAEVETGRQVAPELVITQVERLPAGGVLRERLQLFDPSVLFMSGWGGAESIPPRPDGDLTGPIPPVLRFAPTAPAREVLRPRPPSTPQSGADLLAKNRWFQGMTRQDDVTASQPLAVRAARVEVFRMGDAARVAALDLANADGLGEMLWRPLVLTVFVNAAGAVAQPVVAMSSGVDEVDERIRWIVGHELLPRLALRPGIYRLEVGP